MLLCRNVGELPGVLVEVYFELCAGRFGDGAGRLMVVPDEFIVLIPEVL